MTIYNLRVFINIGDDASNTVSRAFSSNELANAAKDRIMAAATVLGIPSDDVEVVIQEIDVEDA